MWKCAYILVTILIGIRIFLIIFFIAQNEGHYKDFRDLHPGTHDFVRSPNGSLIYAEWKMLLADLSRLQFRGIIVDINFLEKVNQKGISSFNHIKIAVHNSSYNANTSFNNEKVTFEVIAYFDDPVKDYLLFDDNGIQRAVPRMGFLNVSNIQVPENPQLFMNYWKRSTMIECLNIDMNRTDTARYLPIPYSFQKMARLRNILVGYGMFPILLGGTLLGWYRECSIIPHTKDVDFGVFIEQLDPQFEIDAIGWKTPFSMRRRLGMVNDSLEYTVVPNWSRYPAIDIFYLYKENDEYWVGGTGPALEKYRYYYPSFNSTCAADLGGFLFWVPCEPEKLVKADYGKKWRKDHPSSIYTWNKSGRNVRLTGRWPRKMKNRVHVYY